jgi:MFS family permease
MFAIMSTAWVVPGLAGPTMSGFVAEHTSWRFVFLGLLPLVGAAGALALPALRSVPAGTADPIVDRARSARLRGAIRVALGVGALLAGLAGDAGWAGVALVGGGLAVAAPAFLRLVPPGTMRAAAGLPAAVLARGTVTFAFFGADAYVPLALTDTRGTSTTFAGLTVMATTLSWTAAAWMQDRWTLRVGARRLVTVGHSLLVAGIGGAALILWDAVPLWLCLPVFAVAGFGIGLSYAPISFTVLRLAAPGREGEATSSMQLSDLVGVALGTGVGGAAVAVGNAAGWAPDVGIGIGWAVAATVAAIGVGVARRLPDASPAVQAKANAGGSTTTTAAAQTANTGR